MVNPLLKLCCSAVLLAIASISFAAPPNTDETTWREEYAYATGIAFLPYLYPYNKMAHTRYIWTMVDTGGAHDPYAPVNAFWHQRDLTNHENKDGTGPSNDTIYSVAWAYVGDEPLLLSHPDMGDRYFTFQLADMSSDNFGSIGARATGSGAATFAIVPKHYQGKLPDDVKQVVETPTPWFIIAGRTLVDSPEDLLVARKFQDQYQLKTLSEYQGTGKSKVYEPWKPLAPKEDPLAFWRNTAKAMAANPPAANQEGMIAMMKSVGIGPDGDLDAMDEDTKRGLQRAFVDGMAMMREGLMTPPGKKINGWRIPPPSHGRLGTVGKFLDRGMVQSQRGFIANDIVEAIYFTTAEDGTGKPLEGKHNYQLKMPVPPPANGFWSMTVYDDHSDLIDNPIKRYSRGDRSEGLVNDQDGSVTLYLQNKDPGGGKSPNWLPIPADQPFFLMMRVYIPGMEAINGDWTPPKVEQIKAR